ncbi:hypothetical protein EI171_21055 [Bradyrhizobium sp. LCT2]|uniref:hypothetical protein n=1 Tax=Bradyrhizobium sp. LCT2 TaxID=2493093 RepID=UPI001373F6D5|nr:hypothetical protein [Bradyrhizobium sp. LCT2]QHP69556.1 hypothetical protein EI171_21055 [Bradyrhizobium sp. LCT2]
MSQASQTNIIIGPWAQPPQSLTAIQELWEKYQSEAALKQRIYSLFNRVAVVGTQDEIDQAEAACDRAHDVLSDLSEAILEAETTDPKADLPIKAQVVARREADLGAPCDEGEIASFCRDVQIALLGHLPTQ